MTEAADPPLVRGWRWRLAGPPGPPLELALAVGEAARSCLIKTAKRLIGSPLLPNCLHGGGSGAPHGHAFYRPEDLDGDGRIDHLLVFAAGGIDGDGLALLAGCREALFLGGRGAWALAPRWMGETPAERCYSPARTWRSVTPYCPPWRIEHSGRDRDPAMQVRREAALLGLPAIIAVEELPPALDRAFQVERRKGERPPNKTFAFLRLRFADPVAGPLAFGFGCHFGLGSFVAAEPVIEIRARAARQNCRPPQTDPSEASCPLPQP
ncbi:MAG TPA: type I-U CRISPR-associated protein Csb2 [Azospirillaceae bacterium]|nr:type I-U CRISPR-associated protein Csb2 [Azospirillaceae bacterium]